ncbi:MAG: DNA translocase FtsK 4TM domain-containing protein [Candidatus Glassbacteria bacterium]|nr:DNA translocase FtsK 4TM domain-containing protein [Candidatus Glassbacteria bacterium]
MPRLTRDKKEEILGLLMIAVGLLVALSLLPQGLAVKLAPETGAQYRNLIGLAGKFINESLKDLVGLLAYTVPLYLVLWGWRIFRGHPCGFYLRATVLLAVLGLGATVLTGLAQLDTPAAGLDFSSGRLGAWLAGLLATGLGPLGAYVSIVLLLLVCLVALTGLSLRSVVEGLIRALGILAAFFGWLFSRARQVRPGHGRKPRRKPAAEAAVKVEPAAGLPTVRAEIPEQAVERADDFQFDLGLPRADLGEDESKGRPGSTPKTAGIAEEEKETPVSRASGEAIDRQAGYVLPEVDLLDPVEEKKLVSREDLEQMGRVLMAKLADFSVSGELLNITRGPQVSTFEVRPAPGIKVGKIASLADDLAMAMHAKRIRIVAPIPGKGAVGVELPNPAPELVYAREIFDSPVFRDESLLLPLGLGKDLEGRIRVADLTRMPHLLIAGTTGSGKSVCMNVLIASLLFCFGPERVRLLMIDPKMIELTHYNDIPHQLHPVVTDAKEAARIFKWAVLEMETRYKLLSRNSVRNIQDFNYKVESGKPIHLLTDDEPAAPERLPYIIIMIDELSDLMCSDVRNEIEGSLVRLAQMARAVGIHLIVATQRPSVDVITGLIKANFPSRLSFQVYSKIDSRTILDTNGAEQLLRNGDMLFIPAGQADPVRIQGAYFSTGETERLVAHWRAQVQQRAGEDEDSGELQPAAGTGILNGIDGEGGGAAMDDEVDELFAEAARLVVRHDQGSTSLIQRRLKVGYARAGRIVDQLERAGILGPPDGSKAREVLITPDQLRDYGIEE